MDNDAYDTDGFDSVESDFDSGSDDKVENITDSTETQMDAIASLISGDSTKADALAEKGGRGSNKSVGGSVNIDSHGRMDFGGNDTPQASTEKVSEYGISGINTQSAIDTAQREVDQATAAYAKLTEMYNSGEIDDATFQHYSNVAGNHAGIHTRQLLESQLAQRDHADQQRQAYDYLEQQFPGKFADPQARSETLNSVVDWMVNEQGLDKSYLMDVEDPRIISTALNAKLAIERDSEQRDQIAGLKAQVKRLKQARGEGRKQGRRASEVGVRGDKQSAMIDEVAALISQAPSKGGRR